MSILEKIQAIKLYKLQRAEKALIGATTALMARRKAVEAANQTLESYIVWRQTEERQLDQEAFSQPLSLKALDDLHFKIGLLRAKDTTLRQSILDAEKQADLAAAFREECQKNVHQAEKQLEKYRLLLEQEIKKEQKLKEIEEEQSLDEFVIRQRA